MASHDGQNSTENNEISSEDEVLSLLKSKVQKRPNKRKRTPRKALVNYEEEQILPQMFLHIEVGELDEGSLDFSGYRKEIVSSPSDTKYEKNGRKHAAHYKRKKKLNCHQCNASFEYSMDLKNHSIEHQVVTRHKCEPCGRYFTKAFSLRMHSRIHMDKGEICPICGATYSHRITMLRHLNTHEATEPCTRCPLKFQTQDLLDAHLAVHELNEKNGGSVAEAEDRRKPDKTPEPFIEQEILHIKIEPTDSDDENNFIAGLSDHTSYQKREDLNYAAQCAIVSKMHKGRSVSDICLLYKLPPEVVNEIWEDRDKYTLPKKAGKKYMNGILDARLVEWFNSQRAMDIQVSGKMLQDVAESFAKESGFVAFNGSKKWLDRFKAKHKISLRGNPPKRDYSNIAFGRKWKNQFFKETWCDVRAGVADEDIYTADEVGVYYNPSKGRIKKMSGKKYIQGYVKDRLALFVCANVTGRDKRRLVVCGTEDPLVHSHRNPDTLPVKYIRHAQAHFTTQMFEEYVKYWNRELQIQNRKAVLILDRATIHSKLSLSNLKLVFVPWKAYSGLIPVRNGIFARLRSEFRRLFHLEKAMNAVRGVDRYMTCLEALYMLDSAWKRVPPHVINGSFLAIGYDVQKVEEAPKRASFTDNDEDMLCKFLKDYDVELYFTDLSHLDMYLTVDEELLTGQGTNGSVFGGNHKVVDKTACEKEKQELLPIGTEKPESSDTESIISKNRAFQDLEIVRRYLQTTNTTFSEYTDFMAIETFLLNNSFDEES